MQFNVVNMNLILHNSAFLICIISEELGHSLDLSFTSVFEINQHVLNQMGDCCDVNYEYVPRPKKRIRVRLCASSKCYSNYFLIKAQSQRLKML